MPKNSQFPRRKFCGSRNLSTKMRKGWLPKKVASKLKKLELNCNNLELKSKKAQSDCARKSDPSVSPGLKVKNKTVRVLFDSGSSGDLKVNAFTL